MSKISELSDGGSLVSTDFLIAVRSGGNVKVQMDTINVDQVDLGDNEFIRLGNSQDLTLVHTSTQSIINQAGVGDLLIQKGGATKLTINSSGINVTGSVTADGLVVDGASSGSTVATFTANANVDTPLLVFQRPGGAVAGKIAYDDTNTAITFGTTTNHEVRFLTNNTEKMQLTADGNVGIGTSSFNATYAPRLQVTSAASDGTGGVLIQNYLPTLTLEDISGGAAASQIQQDQTNMLFKNNGAERMRIDSSGSTSFTLGTNAVGTFNDAISEVGSGNFALQVTNSAGSALKPLGFRAEDIRFATGSAERMRITSAGALQLSDVNSPNDINTAIYSNSDVLEFEAFGTNGAIAFSTGSGVDERMRIDLRAPTLALFLAVPEL